MKTKTLFAAAAILGATAALAGDYTSFSQTQQAGSTGTTFGTAPSLATDGVSACGSTTGAPYKLATVADQAIGTGAFNTVVQMRGWEYNLLADAGCGWQYAPQNDVVFSADGGANQKGITFSQITLPAAACGQSPCAPRWAWTAEAVATSSSPPDAGITTVWQLWTP